MSLQTILTRISSDLGISITTESELDWAITKVNELAKELYDSKDIKDCLREVTINLDTDDEGPVFSSLVSLPHFVGELRGIRYSNITGGKIPLNDMRPRYHSGKGWGANSFAIPYRLVREDAPIKHDIVNASVLTISVDVAESVDVHVVVVGQTDNSSRVQEIITLTAGQLTVDSVGNFEEIESISKLEYTNNDIIITDVESNEIATIPNNSLQSLYKWLELNDANASIAGTAALSGQLSAIDLLFKQRFMPFVNLYDEFVCRGCDSILFYKFAAWYEAKTPGYEQRALMAQGKADELLSNLLIDSETGVAMEMQFGPNGLLEVQQPASYYGGYRFRSV